jgi:hypothetical protein
MCCSFPTTLLRWCVCLCALPVAGRVCSLPCSPTRGSCCSCWTSGGLLTATRLLFRYQWQPSLIGQQPHSSLPAPPCACSPTHSATFIPLLAQGVPSPVCGAASHAYGVTPRLLPLSRRGSRIPCGPTTTSCKATCRRFCKPWYVAHTRSDDLPYPHPRRPCITPLCSVLGMCRVRCDAVLCCRFVVD